jgi:hypothetical protein
MGWTIGVLGFDSRRGLRIFLFTTASRTALGPTQPPIQWVKGALSLGVERPGRESDYSPPSSAEVKEWVELYIHSPNTPSWIGAQLKHRDNFTFIFYLYTITLINSGTALVSKHYSMLSQLCHFFHVLHDIISPFQHALCCLVRSSSEASVLYKMLYIHTDRLKLPL